MESLAMLSMHTSPLAQPGTGDGGGMNVYVRQLATALARRGVRCDVYTRADSPDVPAVARVEPNFLLHHIAAGPLAPVPKRQLAEHIAEFTDGVSQRFTNCHTPEALHANYWLSGVAGHELKHQFDLPLACTFHTLARVKARASQAEPGDADRARAETEVVGCCDAIVASCPDEVSDLVALYGAEPSRVKLLSPGVERAYFSPGDRAGARRAIGLPASSPVILFVGRLQPLKGVDVAVEAFARVWREPAGRDALLVVVGGPSGATGDGHLASVRRLAEQLGVGERVRWVEPQPHYALGTYYRAADVVLVPSSTESFGLVALEAAACATPVVASAVGGLRWLVDDGVTGRLVSDRRPETFAAAVLGVLTDPGLATVMGAAAARTTSGHTWAAAAEGVTTLFEELTDQVLVACQ